MRRIWKGLLFVAIISFPPTGLSAEETAAPAKNRLAIGVNNLGGQILYRFRSPLALEARYTTGKDETDTNKDVTSNVFGVRLYWFFGEGDGLGFYSGLEGAIAEIDVENTTLDTSGYIGGGFAGLQYRFGGRWAFGFDIGPYYVALEEATSDLDDSSVEIVGNAFINFYLF